MQGIENQDLPKTRLERRTWLEQPRDSHGDIPQVLRNEFGVEECIGTEDSVGAGYRAKKVTSNARHDRSKPLRTTMLTVPHKETTSKLRQEINCRIIFTQ